MLRKLGSACVAAPREQSVVSQILRSTPGATVYACPPGGRALLVRQDTEAAARLLCDLDAARVVLTARSAPAPAAPAPALVMHELETDVLFSPRSSPSPLAKILCRRATCENLEELLCALLEHGAAGELGVSVTDVNCWLAKHGLARYCLLTVRAMRKQGLQPAQRTLVDDMVVGCLGYHAIWVKDAARYTRPEIDIHRYDVQALASAEHWARVRHVPRAPPLRAVLVHAYLDGGTAVPYLITVFPDGRVFVDCRSGAALLAAFLRWLRGLFTPGTRRIYLVGFLSSLFDLELLRAHWPRERSGWRVVGHSLVYRHRYAAVLIDAARYADGASLREYCARWAGFAPRAPAELLLRADTLRREGELADASRECAHALFEAVRAQQELLRRLVLVSDLARFPGLSGLLLANAALAGASAQAAALHFPAHPDAQAFVRESVADECVWLHAGAESCFLPLRSVLQHVAEAEYPLGKPYFTQTCNPARLSLALCEVTRKDSLQVPFLFAKGDPQATRFDAVLTSVDISTAVQLGGYQIRVRCALEWAQSGAVLRAGVSELVATAAAIEDERAAHLVARLASSPDLLGDQLAWTGQDAPQLLLTAFAVSYCRRRVHACIAKMDNHYHSAYVTGVCYNGVYVHRSFAKLMPELDLGEVESLLAAPR
ncbi:EEV maturation protein [Equine molluscum contagiosum-like virus]|nr:EEV maturation protein [Equine molluscum contagiosum-like virus]